VWIRPDAFPSSAAFDAINEALQADPKEREQAIKTAKGIFAFTLKNTEGKTESWHIDLKDKGVVAKGLGTKPTCMSCASQPVSITILLPSLLLTFCPYQAPSSSAMPTSRR